MNNRVQHYECISRETVWKCMLLSPYLNDSFCPFEKKRYTCDAHRHYDGNVGQHIIQTTVGLLSSITLSLCGLTCRRLNSTKLLFMFLGKPWTLKDPFVPLYTGKISVCQMWIVFHWFTASQPPQFCLHFALNSLLSFIHNALHAVNFSTMAYTKQNHVALWPCLSVSDTLEI